MKADSMIFDLDGTLWDSIAPVTESWNQVIERRLGKEARICEQDIHDCMGMVMEDIGRKLFPQLPEEEMLSVLRECCSYENEYVAKTGGRLFDGVEETLKELSQRMPLFIVSNCQDGYIEAFFEAHGLQKYFKDYENPGRSGFAKAENIALVMERNALKQPVYVGDTKGDCEASKKAGVPFVFAAYGFGEVKDSECAGKIHAFRELTKIETI
ncbi:MAG: HAD family hydrolase [bacterium]|nr:HAD family hydrolase [bacterium]